MMTPRGELVGDAQNVIRIGEALECVDQPHSSQILARLPDAFGKKLRLADSHNGEGAQRLAASVFGQDLARLDDARFIGVGIGNPGGDDGAFPHFAR